MPFDEERVGRESEPGSSPSTLAAAPPAPEAPCPPGSTDCVTDEERKLWRSMRFGAAASVPAAIAVGAGAFALADASPLLGAALGLAAGIGSLAYVGRVLAQGVKSPAFQRWLAVRRS